MSLYQRRLYASPADHNELHSLELLWLGNPCTVQELTWMVREKDPSALFLIETWADDPQLELLRIQLHFSNKLVVPRRNKRGGLALFWKQDLDLQISSYSYSHIDTIIDATSGALWLFTGFYRAPDTHRREVS